SSAAGSHPFAENRTFGGRQTADGRCLQDSFTKIPTFEKDGEAACVLPSSAEENTMTRWMTPLIALLLTTAALAGEKTLFIWAGDQSRPNPAFLAVVDFDEHSPKYGSVIATVPLTGAGATGNEPHHVGLSHDGKILGAGGLLSVLKGQPEIFFFDVS